MQTTQIYLFAMYAINHSKDNLQLNIPRQRSHLPPVQTSINTHLSRFLKRRHEGEQPPSAAAMRLSCVSPLHSRQSFRETTPENIQSSARVNFTPKNDPRRRRQGAIKNFQRATFRAQTVLARRQSPRNPRRRRQSQRKVSPIAAASSKPEKIWCHRHRQAPSTGVEKILHN